MLVVGAGPAGCAAAMKGAMHGLRVAVVERARFPRDLPGESLHPDIDMLFNELGVRDAVAGAGFLRHPGWLLEQGEGSSYVAFGEPGKLKFGYQAWRADLDSILLEKAQECGVDVLPDTDAREVLMSDGRVAGIELSDGCLTATFLVDATGPRRWLSRKLSIPSELLSPRLVARYGYSDQDFGVGIIPRFREHASGWTWLAKVRDNTWQCVQLSLNPGEELPPLPSHFGFPDRLQGADVTWRLIRECAGPGYFICGDAVATIDPAASRGVARALQSGIRAADLVVDVCQGACDEKDAAGVYREWLADTIKSEAWQLAERYAFQRNAPDWVRQFRKNFADAAAV